LLLTTLAAVNIDQHSEQQGVILEIEYFSTVEQLPDLPDVDLL
jgi:hypothetical protein